MRQVRAGVAVRVRVRVEPLALAVAVAVATKRRGWAPSGSNRRPAD